MVTTQNLVEPAGPPSSVHYTWVAGSPWRFAGRSRGGIHNSNNEATFPRRSRQLPNRRDSAPGEASSKSEHGAGVLVPHPSCISICPWRGCATLTADGSCQTPVFARSGGGSAWFWGVGGGSHPFNIVLCLPGLCELWGGDPVR